MLFRSVHDAAFSEAPTNLGQHIAEGSFFKNGEITLEFKGLGVANNHQCVILGIDSGESLFKMIYQPMPNLNVITVCSSHYQGDILKSLSNNWMQKVQFTEVVICETTLPMPPNKINLVVERNIQIVNVNEERFYAELNQ